MEDNFYTKPEDKVLPITRLKIFDSLRSKKINPSAEFIQEAIEFVLEEYGLVMDQLTGKSLSEALIFASTNPQYDKRLFIELQVQYMKIPSSEHGVNMLWTEFFLTFKTIYVHNMFSPCSELVVFMYWTGKLMNNLLSYCGSADVRKNASDKDLPVLITLK